MSQKVRIDGGTPIDLYAKFADKDKNGKDIDSYVAGAVLSGTDLSLHDGNSIPIGNPIDLSGLSGSGKSPIILSYDWTTQNPYSSSGITVTPTMDGNTIQPEDITDLYEDGHPIYLVVITNDSALGNWVYEPTSVNKANVIFGLSDNVRMEGYTSGIDHRLVFFDNELVYYPSRSLLIGHHHRTVLNAIPLRLGQINSTMDPATGTVSYSFDINSSLTNRAIDLFDITDYEAKVNGCQTKAVQKCYRYKPSGATYISTYSTLQDVINAGLAQGEIVQMYVSFIDIFVNYRIYTLVLEISVTGFHAGTSELDYMDAFMEGSLTYQSISTRGITITTR